MRLVVVILLALAPVARAQESAAGRWQGSVQIPDRELQVTVDLAQNEKNAPWMGSIIIPGLVVKGAPLSGIEIGNATVSFVFKTGGGQGLNATFKGRLSPDGSMSGDFAQAGLSAPFVLKRIGPPQVELLPKSTAVAKECEGEWKGEYELFGYPRKVTLKLANHGADGATADFVIVGKKTNNLPVDMIAQEEDLLTVDSHETGISYEGRLNKPGNEIRGTLAQGPIEVPLTLRR